MFIFETYLKEIKHEVLKNIAILAKENRLTTEDLFNIHTHIVDKDKPKTRCCVYKERAIVDQRVKLAAGYLPVGEDNNNLVDIKGNNQIIYILEAACDRCPLNKYTVTEACRGCVAHKCTEVCPTKAVTRVAGKAYINQDLCKECGLCKKNCPYDAISEVLRPCKVVCPTGALTVNTEDRRALITTEDCVQCGACMNACPFGAISDKSLISPVAEKLGHGLKMIALVAPALAGQFGPEVTMGQVKTALKNIGFIDMLEVSCGADIVTVHETLEFAKRMEEGEDFMTSSCCPGFLSYIEKKFPGLVNKASSTVSPMIALGRLVKETYKDTKVVFIGPCTAKKAEIKRDGLKGTIDYVLTFEELSALLAAFNMDPEHCEEATVDDGSIFGRGFGAAGGLTAAIENYIATENLNASFKPIKAVGSQDVKKIMTMAKVGRLNNNFIEGMMCEGGCIGGAGTILPPLSTKGTFMKENQKATAKTVSTSVNLKDFENIDLER